MSAPTDKRIVPTPGVLTCTPIKHRTTNGLEFWYDYDSDRIVTEDPEISINFVWTSGWDAVMYVYLQMHNLSIHLGQKDDQPFPISVYRGPKLESVWEIGSIGIPLYFNILTKRYTHHFLPNAASSFQPIAVDTGFSSMEQQSTAIKLISEVLGRYDGHWLGACRGLEQSAAVAIDPELSAKLNSGKLVE